ncbi:MAG: hypothetical protein OHK0056_03340 [Bacteriovoracaceae bacterium]
MNQAPSPGFNENSHYYKPLVNFYQLAYNYGDEILKSLLISNRISLMSQQLLFFM